MKVKILTGEMSRDLANGPGFRARVKAYNATSWLRFFDLCGLYIELSNEIFQRFRIALVEVVEATRNFTMGMTSSEMVQKFLREFEEIPNQLRRRRWKPLLSSST